MAATNAQPEMSDARRRYRLLAEYQPFAGVPDEVLSPAGDIRPVWSQLLHYLDNLDPAEMTRRFARADRYLRDAGVFFRQSGDDEFTARRWPLGHVPVLIAEAEWQTIVGVVRNVRHINLAEDTGPEMYIPVTQGAFEWATFVVRARSGSAEMLANPIREAIRRVDPELPVFNVQTMTEVVDRSLARTSVVTALLTVFASVGLALAGIGVFSVVSYSVGRRVREVAVRMALGGTPRKVVALIMRQGLIPVCIGFLFGTVTALAFSRLLNSRLYGVAAHDPMTYGGIAFLILAIAALAIWLPARRAAGVEPITVLRSE